MTPQEALTIVALKHIPATYKRTIEFLGGEGKAAEDIAEHLGMTLSSTYKLICTLKQYKVVCVVGYLRTHAQGPWIKLYGIGSKDARHPPKVEPKDRSKAWREKQKRLQTAVPRLGMFGI